MRTSNPALSDKALERAVYGEGGAPPPADMAGGFTLDAVVQRTFVLLALVGAGAVFGWNLLEVDPVTGVALPGWIMPLALAMLAVAFLTFFRPRLAAYSGPVWALGEGVLMGVISAAYEVRFDGIVVQAVAGTLMVAAVTLVLYTSGRLRATPQFRKVTVVATLGVMGLYLLNLGLRLFGGDGIGFIHDTGIVGIGFSLLVIVLAAANLVLDFDLIERGQQQGWPRHMAWYAAFALVVTLVWLYLEMLRLLSKLRN